MSLPYAPSLGTTPRTKGFSVICGHLHPVIQRWEGPGFGFGASFTAVLGPVAIHGKTYNLIGWFLVQSLKTLYYISFQDVLVSQDIDVFVHNESHCDNTKQSNHGKDKLGDDSLSLILQVFWWRPMLHETLHHHCYAMLTLGSSLLVQGHQWPPHLQAISGGLWILFKS